MIAALFNDVFYSCLNAKVKQTAFTNTEAMIFVRNFWSYNFDVEIK